MEKYYCAYFRVSTVRQGASGLGLDAQREAVLSFIRHNGNKIIAEFTEVETGKNDKRPELKKAINLCQEKNAVLVVAKLDRLSRNLTFLSQLMDSKIKFICADMPDANELTISIFASLAQWERKRISERTKEALAQKRLKNPAWKPGKNNLTDAGRKKSQTILRENSLQNENNRHAFHFIKPLREIGYSWEKIAEKLNSEGYTTRKNNKFHPWQAWNIYRKYTEAEKGKDKNSGNTHALRTKIEG